MAVSLRIYICKGAFSLCGTVKDNRCDQGIIKDLSQYQYHEYTLLRLAGINSAGKLFLNDENIVRYEERIDRIGSQVGEEGTDYVLVGTIETYNPSGSIVGSTPAACTILWQIDDDAHLQ